MPIATVNALGRDILAAMRVDSDAASECRTFLQHFRSDPQRYEDDAGAWLACVLALQGMASGNFGVGCVLLDADGGIAAYGHNQMFTPHFRSDLHAEMAVMNAFEAQCSDDRNTRGYKLLTSLEPCPMCTVRLISSRIADIRYVATDLRGGMARQAHRLPEFWVELAGTTNFKQAACSAALRETAEGIFRLNLDAMAARLDRV